MLYRQRKLNCKKCQGICHFSLFSPYFSLSIQFTTGIMSQETLTVLLNRILSLREQSRFLLVLDSVLQSSVFLIRETVFKCGECKIIYILFETSNRPNYATEYIEAALLPTEKLVAEYVRCLERLGPCEKCLVIVDSVNYIEPDHVVRFIGSLARPHVTVIATYHTNAPAPRLNNPYYPLPLSLVSYIANSILEVSPLEGGDDEQVLEQVSRLQPCVGVHFNSPVFQLVLTHRKKSGRSTTHKFKVDTVSHEYQILKADDQVSRAEDESMLLGLTTFNLTTNSKQKLAREQVELPFMEAQQALGKMGGAIVYEFEKDDDYDEEDPYEDPF